LYSPCIDPEIFPIQLDLLTLRVVLAQRRQGKPFPHGVEEVLQPVGRVAYEAFATPLRQRDAGKVPIAVRNPVEWASASWRSRRSLVQAATTIGSGEKVPRPILVRVKSSRPAVGTRHIGWSGTNNGDIGATC